MVANCCTSTVVKYWQPAHAACGVVDRRVDFDMPQVSIASILVIRENGDLDHERADGIGGVRRGRLSVGR